jgi:hypothetical protein
MSFDGRDDGAEGFPISLPIIIFPSKNFWPTTGIKKRLSLWKITNNGGANSAVPGIYGEGQSVGHLSVASL